MDDHRSLLEPGTILDGKYRIDQVIGLGGFGITYSAFDLGLATWVAIKEYYPTQLARRDTTLSVRPASGHDRPLFERLRSSFLREARTLAQFDHPTIVRVRNVFEGHGTAYMVMQLENGPSLKRWIAELGRRPTEPEIEGIAASLLNGLEVMHAAAYLHRDIAPDNIIIRDNGSPVILDFGASRRVLIDQSSTMTGIVKRGYSPQEQYSTDGRAQGPWTDIYALGATLYHAVTGRPPVDATARMLDAEMPSASELGRGHYRPAFLAAIDWAMQLRPSERPQSIAAWREQLFGAETPVKPVAAVARAVTHSAPKTRPRPMLPASPEPQIEVPSSLPVRRRGWALGSVGGTAALVMIAATAGAMMFYSANLFLTSPRVASPSVFTEDVARQNQERADRALADAAARIQQEASERRAREDDARKAKEQSDRIAAEAVTRKQREDAEQRAREEAARKAKEQADRFAAEAAARKQREDAEQRVREETARKAKEQADRLAAEAAARRQREDAEQRVREETARKAKEQADNIAAEAAARTQREDATRPQKPGQPSATPSGLVQQHAVVGKIRRELNRVGCHTSATTPGWSDADQKALERFVKLAGTPFSFNELNDEIVEAVGSYVGRVCPLECAPGETAVTDRCVPAGSVPQVKPVLCNQINDRAQLGILTEDDREQLRSGRCR